MSFDTVLIANRGEIAVRIIRSAAALGYRTVAVYSDADAGAPHVLLADEAVYIGQSAARESYLNTERLLAAAKSAGATAIHPGYGFVSENAAFAQACVDAGLTFIGPTPETIRAMGDKAAAKRMMADAGVPLLPGYQGVQQDDERLLSEATHIGFPLMVKAAAGGGGKGMRLLMDHADLPDAIAAARREALSAFGSDTLILERALLRPRHVEIQILADTHGHVIALGERDCSVQRRHQKVIEESPCPAITEATRRAMSEAAVTAAKSVGYVGAGTVEFLLDSDGTFAFLEMNTRLQVEHPVTELVTGLDLVAWQLRIAAGEPLTIGQDDVRLTGHAIEARLYAEQPGNNYLPVTGRIERWTPPGGDGVRVDAGIDTGINVTPHYDPMLAKIVAYGSDRDEARRRLINALERTSVLGLATNRGFLSRILRHTTFAAGEATTAFLNDTDLTAEREPTTEELAIAAALIHRERTIASDRRSPGLTGWSNAAGLRTAQRLMVGGRTWEVDLFETRDQLTITVDGRAHIATIADGTGIVGVDGRTVTADYWFSEHGRVAIRFDRLDLDVRDVLFAEPDGAQGAGTGAITAPMHGTVTARLVEAGQPVAAGQRLLVLEAMKMEQPLYADVDGTISEIVAPGTQVAANDVIARINPSSAQAAE